MYYPAPGAGPLPIRLPVIGDKNLTMFSQIKYLPPGLPHVYKINYMEFSSRGLNFNFFPRQIISMFVFACHVGCHSAKDVLV